MKGFLPLFCSFWEEEEEEEKEEEEEEEEKEEEEVCECLICSLWNALLLREGEMTNFCLKGRRGWRSFKKCWSTFSESSFNFSLSL